MPAFARDLPLTLLLLLSTSLQINAAPGPLQHELWKSPSGNVSDDFITQYASGDSVNLQWNRIDPKKWYNFNITQFDLWAVTFDWDTTKAPYSKRLQQKVDVTKSGNFTWKIDIPDSTLAVDGEYFVTFKAPSSKYSEKANGLPSPGFTILNKQGKLNTTLPTLVNGTLASNSSSSDGPSLSTAAEVGVGIGAGAAAFALIGTAAALFFRNRKKPEGDAEASQAPSRSQSNMGEA